MDCPSCHKPVPNDVKICSNCGAHIPESTAGPDQTLDEYAAVPSLPSQNSQEGEDLTQVKSNSLAGQEDDSLTQVKSVPTQDERDSTLTQITPPSSLIGGVTNMDQGQPIYPPVSYIVGQVPSVQGQPIYPPPQAPYPTGQFPIQGQPIYPPPQTPYPTGQFPIQGQPIYPPQAPYSTGQFPVQDQSAYLAQPGYPAGQTPVQGQPIYPPPAQTAYPPQVPYQSGQFPPIQGGQPIYPAQSLYPAGQTPAEGLPIYPPGQTAYPPHPYATAPIILPANPNWVQRLFIKLFQPRLASNPWLSIILGGVMAALLGVLVFLAIFPFAHNLLPQTSMSGTSLTEGDLSIESFFNITETHNPFRDATQLLLVAHGTGEHIQSSANDTSTTSGTSTIPSSTEDFTVPLNGFLLLPALFLIFGGYIAAGSDFRNRPVATLLRGAAISIPYTFLLFLLSMQVNGPLPNFFNTPSTSTFVYQQTLSMDIPSLFLFGLLWGALFGVIGASLKLGQGQWRHMLHTYLWTNRKPQLIATLTGGVVAIILGICLSLLVFFCLAAFTAFSVPFLAKASCANGGWQNLTLWSIAQAPFHAVMLLAFSLGAPITLSNTASNIIGGCFYTNSAHQTVSLLGGDTHLQSWMYAILLLSFISLFIGGRVSALLGRAQGVGPAAIQGALITIPFTILMMLLVAMNMYTHTYNPGDRIAGVQSAGVAVFDVLLWALVCGAVFGGIGGVYQASGVKIIVRQVITAFSIPLLIAFSPIFILLDRLSGRPRGHKRDRAHTLLYSAIICTIILTIIAIFTGIQFISLSRMLTIDMNQHIRDIVAIVLVGLPGLLLVGTATSAIATDPAVNYPQQSVFSPGNMPPATFTPPQGGIV